MTELIFDIFLYCFEMVTAYVFISYNYYKKSDKVSKIITVGLLLFLSGAVLLFFIDNDILNTIAVFVINALFFIICFDVKIFEAVIFSVLLDAVMFCSEMVTIFCSSYIMKIPTDTYQNNFYTFAVLTIISKIIYFAVAQLLAFIINKFKFKSDKSLRFVPLFIFPILTIAMSFLFLKMSFTNKYSNTYNIAFMVLNILMIAACIYIFVYYQLLTKKDARLNELQAENKLLDINNDYIEILQNQNDEMHMLFHDSKNHLLTISNMDNTEDIHNYVSGIIGDMQKYDVIRRTDNRLLDLLLSKYIVLCRNSNVTLSIEVKTANLSYVPDSDLSIIINNLMDNALEAAKYSIEREIDFSLRCVNNFDILNISNSCDEKPAHNGKKLVTTKASKELHGFGTRIIKKYANKNNARFEWFYDEEKKRFNSTIIFNH